MSAGGRIAQLSLFPYLQGKAAPVERGTWEYWKTMRSGKRWFTIRPQLIVRMNGVEMQGLQPKMATSEGLYTVYRDWQIISSNASVWWNKCEEPEGRTEKLRSPCS